jgi:hypothetical protein
MSEIKHWVQVVDGEVVHCWDRAPDEGVGVNGWREAVEVRPVIQENRQGYTAHRFDITQDPVEIVYDVYDIPVGSRKSSLKGHAKAQFSSVVTSHSHDTENFDLSTISDYQKILNNRLSAIDNCLSHNDLDTLPRFTGFEEYIGPPKEVKPLVVQPGHIGDVPTNPN